MASVGNEIQPVSKLLHKFTAEINALEFNDDVRMLHVILMTVFEIIRWLR